MSVKSKPATCSQAAASKSSETTGATVGAGRCAGDAPVGRAETGHAGLVGAAFGCIALEPTRWAGDAAANMSPVNPATLLARLTVEALRVGGIRHVVLCPGSRSAPLAYALGSSDAVDLRIRHDERVAAFTAMGAAGAVVTTSGTAAANLHPAVLEAHHGRRPLV